jgi:hypothetical protein
MDETNWRTTTTERFWMLDYIRGRATPRQLRLFGCACVRRVWDLLSDDERVALERVEDWAEGRTSGPVVPDRVARLGAAGVAGSREQSAILAQAALRLFDPNPDQAIHAAAHVLRTQPIAGWRSELGQQCDLVRCIFGNPFRTPGEGPWRQADQVHQIAQAIAEEQRFADLPILADALEDAGCTDSEILAHLRGPGPHALGCWPLDLILTGR